MNITRTKLGLKKNNIIYMSVFQCFTYLNYIIFTR